jgi:phenylalanine-4-hydroxylase
MNQEYSKYNDIDKWVWKTLFNNQVNNFTNKVSDLYIRSLNEISILNQYNIINIKELNKVLAKQTGWCVEIVPGLIEREKFFELLSQRKFCASTWLRPKDKLDYLEEPDMFHDIFGHIPMLVDSEYASFVNRLGVISLGYLNNEDAMTKIQRLYWFTIEFGVIEEDSKVVSYGAGIISSTKETNKVYNEEGNFIKFNLEDILNKDFCIDDVQNTYYVIDSYEELYNSLDDLEFALK